MGDDSSSGSELYELSLERLIWGRDRKDVCGNNWAAGLLTMRERLAQSEFVALRIGFPQLNGCSRFESRNSPLYVA
jgi:hypothetical protein